MLDEGPKREAANAAVERYVVSGMVVGLGTGSTATFAVQRIGDLVASGELRDVRGVPTSARTTALANELGIPLATLSEARPRFTIDGADEVSPELALIKGRGGALLREKIVASSSEEGLIVVADSSKLVGSLGAGPLPVEIDSFGWESTLEALASLGCEPELRMDWTDPGRPFVTDGGHYTADCTFEQIADPASLEVEIKHIPGALECGLFVGLARAAVVAGETGTEVIEASPR
ncbi:MAG: Ribose 5-phosphate isomerase A [uncultured Rubrobacteraceae bacterium]|uniref:Ribose-5-phosphate isomerase A n=1 Tax=uncultured Rubrobacteraceae bacterium TaxID=349277 RepID=A0A6J4QUB1_9ACTN|nr:MAG: Ribose 5-phosphate isomerase A [uncultured Rubrobacteraceae bacterium]